MVLSSSFWWVLAGVRKNKVADHKESQLNTTIRVESRIKTTLTRNVPIRVETYPGRAKYFNWANGCWTIDFIENGCCTSLRTLTMKAWPTVTISDQLLAKGKMHLLSCKSLTGSERRGCSAPAPSHSVRRGTSISGCVSRCVGGFNELTSPQNTKPHWTGTCSS